METIQIKALKASEGMWLRNGDVFCKYVQLAPNSKASDWTEVTNEEKEAYEREHSPEVEPDRHGLD